MGSAPRPKPRVTEADPHFKEAVAAALRAYQHREQINDAELAARLGVSTSALSKYLNCKQLIGGEILVRAITDLGITVHYRDKDISIRASPEQVTFAFDPPCLLKETPEAVTVTVERKQPNRSHVVLAVKLAG